MYRLTTVIFSFIIFFNVHCQFDVSRIAIIKQELAKKQQKLDADKAHLHAVKTQAIKAIVTMIGGFAVTAVALYYSPRKHVPVVCGAGMACSLLAPTLYCLDSKHYMDPDSYDALKKNIIKKKAKIKGALQVVKLLEKLIAPEPVQHIQDVA